MNADTQVIAKALNICLDEALKIQNFMDDNALMDWSQDSNAKMIRIAKSVVKSEFAELVNA